MTTDRDLDALLMTARPVDAAELPTLPEAFLDHLHTSDPVLPGRVPAPATALVSAPPQLPASVLAAGQLVNDAHQRRSGTDGRGRRVLRRPALLLAAAAAVTAAVALAVAPGSTPQAFADYTFTPTPLSPQQASEQVQACRSRLAQPGSTWAQDRSDLIEQSVPVVVDARGSWTHTVLVSTKDPQLGTVVSDCLLNTRSGLGGVSSGDDPRRTSADLGEGIRTVTATSVGGSDQSDVAAVLTGRAAPDVTSVAVRLPDGHTVTAALTDGWWSAWWPGQLGSEAGNPTAIEYTTSSGRRVTVVYADAF